MPQLVIIADDITGAADTGAPFAQAHFHTVLALNMASLPSAAILVISTESRHLSAAAACTRVREAAVSFRDAPLLYKKIDSTLRGHPGAELMAVMAALQSPRALVAPAFPAQARTTIAGRQYVGGLPLEQTPFASEVTTSDIAAILSAGSAARPTTTHIPLDTVRSGSAAVRAALPNAGIIIADAESDDDLTTLAEAALMADIRVLCGSAGLAQALSSVLPSPPVVMIVPLAQRAKGPVLIVAGSRHPITRRQVYAAADSGAELVTPRADVLSNGAAFAGLVEMVAGALAAGKHTVISTVGMGDLRVSGEIVANMLARAVRELAPRGLIGGLILTGGGIAVAVLRAIGAQAIWLQGEMDNGIPWGILQGGLLPDIPVVTKAGGFGHDDTLAEAIAFLTPALAPVL